MNDCILSVRFGCRTHHGAHIGLVFVRHGRPCLVYDSGCSDVCAFPHINFLACDGNERSGRSGIVVDKDIDWDGIVQNGRTHRVCRIHLAAVCVHMDQDGICPQGIGFRQTTSKIQARGIAYLLFYIDFIY